jgi:two-component system, sensor histidine kinase and response regulator
MSQQVIICVDDEAIVLEALREQLQQEFGDGLLVEIAESGEEALEVYDELLEEGMEIPVIIADFIMPGMKGDDLLEQMHLKSSESKKIMLTGQASLEGVSNAVNKAELYRYISKPWDKSDLILTIKEAIKSFNQGETIRKQNTELRELNIGLESKVAERTKQLEELNATKDKFFSIIAHDLKNPFNTLMGFSELLLEHMDMYSPQQIRDYIGIIFETSQISYNLLENLLDWSRSQTGKLKMDPKVIDLTKMVYTNFQLLENSANNKSVILRSNLQEGISVFADTNMIDTIFRNLISNAIKFTNEGGTITIDSEEEGSMLKLCVADTGIGIKSESINQLFKIGQDVSTKGTANESGTGLGLILCKEFVERNGGEIWVESEVGKGSQFYFTVPLKADK